MTAYVLLRCANCSRTTLRPGLTLANLRQTGAGIGDRNDSSRVSLQQRPWRPLV